MADPRFYDNRGPFAVAKLCAKAAIDCPNGIDRDALIYDVAGLTQAADAHLSFFDAIRAKGDFLATKAGWCLVQPQIRAEAPANTVLLPCHAVGRAFAVIAALFYPEHEIDFRVQNEPIAATARIGNNVVFGSGVVVGPDAEIGDNTQIGPNSVIGRGVTVGRNCRIGPNVSISFAFLGDEILIQPGVVIGGSGFGFFSGAKGHRKTPQLGRVIVQDHVEIGANSTVDRGALGDTVIGEGTKIDNLVQIGHNATIGRHCILAGQSGLSGSVSLGDFVIMGGKVGVADHVTIGDRVRLAALSGVGFDLDSGKDYGGVPARPVRQWKREMALLASLAKKKKTTHE